MMMMMMIQHLNVEPKGRIHSGGRIFNLKMIAISETDVLFCETYMFLSQLK